MQTKIINYTRRFRYNKPLKNINKIEKYKKLNMREHKMDMNIAKIGKYKKTEQHFYHGIQNWHEHYWRIEQHFYEGTLNRTRLYFGESNK